MMSKNMDGKIGSWEKFASSYNDGESMSTSPILDTAKIRDRAKLRLKRRTSSESTYSSNADDVNKPSETKKNCRDKIDDEDPKISLIKSETEKRSSCDRAVEAGHECPDSSKSDGRLDNSLVARLRDLKRRKKAVAKPAESLDAQIDEEEFVKSVRMLDAACYSTPPLPANKSPKRHFGLVSFGELERLNSSQLETSKNLESAVHLSLDEDKEEDLFADARENMFAIEDLEEFSQWKYNPVETLSFRGFSSSECNRSINRCHRISQFCELSQRQSKIRQARGFTIEEIRESHDLLDIWKLLLKKYYPDCWSDWFSNILKTKIHENSPSDKKMKKTISNTGVRKKMKFSDDSENSLSASNETSKIVVSTKNVSIIEKRENSDSRVDREKQLETRGTIGKVVPRVGTKNIDEQSMNDDGSKVSTTSREKCGFSTASGRPLSVSEAAITKAELILSQATKDIVATSRDDPENDDEPISRSKCGFSTAGGRPLIVSEAAIAKAESILSQATKDIVATSRDNPKNADEPISRSKCGFSTAGGRPLIVSEAAITKAELILSQATKDIVATSRDNPENDDEPISRSKCGFSTAGGRPLIVSETAMTKAELILSQATKDIVATSRDNPENDDEPISRSKCGFSTAGGRPSIVSEAAIIKAETRLNEENVNTPNDRLDDEKSNDAINPRGKSGFSTANDRPFVISKTALARSESRLIQQAKITKDAMFDDVSNDATIPSDAASSKAEDISNEDVEWNDDDSQTERSTNVATTSGPDESSTAREPRRKISESSVDPIRPIDIESKDSKFSKIVEIPTTKKLENTKLNEKVNFGFSTAGGKELKISDESWSKAKAAFDAIVEESSIAVVAETFELDDREDSKIPVVTEKMEITLTDFSTASGRTINVATKAVSDAEAQLSNELENMESIDLEDFVDPFEEISEVTRKRKIDEVDDNDDDTPLRRDAVSKTKRTRHSNDLQARKLFDDFSESENDESSTTSEFLKIEETIMKNNFVTANKDGKLMNLSTNDETMGGNDGSIVDRFGDSELDGKTCERSSSNVINPIDESANREEKVNVVDDEDPSTVSIIASKSSVESRDDNERSAITKNNEESQDIQHESIPDDLTFESQFSQDVQRSPVMDKLIVETIKTMEGRLSMASKQDETVREKRRMKPEPRDGALYRLRNLNRNSRITWRTLTDGIAPTAREMSGDCALRDLSSVDANTAEDYSFRCADFYGEKNVRTNIEGIKVGDEAFLILDEKNQAGPREFERAFLASPAVDPNLVPTGWIRNHYRWIVWKLASMDRVKFGHKCLPRMLTPDRVMLELKYRYDREIYKTQWSPLKRILERGEDPSARLVLCVSSIVTEEDANVQIRGVTHTPSSMGATGYKMRVTDGWYSIGTSIDSAMINFIRSGKVREGTKLVISGAKVVNLDQGCSALEVPEAVTLRIYSNSTRRARWDTKLDYYHKNRGPISLSLKSVKPNGGAISKLIVAVSRVYPILYREKLPNGQFVFRNARCDEEAARAHETRYQSKMEEIYANAWSEFQIGKVGKKESGTARRRSYTQEETVPCNSETEEELRQRISSKMRECLPPPRDVTPVMKIRVADDDACALVTVWSTDRDTTELFVEGSSIAIYNAFASGLRSNELQITAGRSTFVKRESSRQISYPKRIYTSLSDVTEPGFTPVYGEFDTIGMVTSTGPAPHGMKNFETVNLACPRTGDDTTSDFLSILFWQGVSAHGYAKILTVGSLVACSNLEWRKNTSRSIPTAYCTERSSFSKNPRQNYLVQPFEILRNEIKEPIVYAAACATLIDEETSRRSASRTPLGSVVGTPYRPATSENRTPGWSPRDSNPSIDANCTTPKMISKRVSTTKRIERLNAYGEPPKLPSITINNSPRISLSGFKSPITNPVDKV